MSDRPAPTLAILPGAGEPTTESGRWRVRWRLENPNAEALRVEQLWAPHSQFWADNRVLDPPIALAAGSACTLELTVACDERPSTVIENTFLILRLRYADRPWRCFARHRVEVDRAGRPLPICEVITVHPVGMSRPEA